MSDPDCEGCKEAVAMHARQSGDIETYGCSKHGPINLKPKANLQFSQEWITKMTDSKYHKSKDDYYPLFSFNIDKGQYKQFCEWYEEHAKHCRFANPANCGAIGGALTYSFTNTSIGQVAKVKCACNQEVDLTEYGDW